MCKFLFSSRVVLAGTLFASLFALAMALIAQLAYNLQPCQMCIYQRIPFVVAAIFAAVGLFWRPGQMGAMGAAGLAMLVNSGLAFYHTGVEQGWFEETAGCKVSFDFDAPGASVQSLMEMISTAQVTSCKKPSWIDPVFGLTMANYNIVYCLGLAVLCLGGVVALKRKRDAMLRAASAE
ncbi:MAG: disulfide bond formation protein B [Alphaproteobacteria bacterium]|nr:disulfide bond formation protein B [Alphaproteobacteria bacterium]HCQ71564.1 disulfide bond formation protein B [Rhodospirillaceae bacterium]|tara:strand:+ start:11023 stop:11559 length:537 start_codon:yes stop_codon:yes gene_type:complete